MTVTDALEGREKQVEELQLKVKKLTETNLSLDSQIQDHKNTIQWYTEEIGGHRNKTGEFQAKVRDLEDKVRDLEAKARNLEGQHDQDLADVANLKSELKKAKTELEGEKTRLSKEQTENHGRGVYIKTIENELTWRRKELGVQIETLIPQIPKGKGITFFENVKERVGELRGKLEKAEADRDHQKNMVESLSKWLAAANESKAKKEKENDRLLKTVSALKKEIPCPHVDSGPCRADTCEKSHELTYGTPRSVLDHKSKQPCQFKWLMGGCRPRKGKDGAVRECPFSHEKPNDPALLVQYNLDIDKLRPIVEARKEKAEEKKRARSASRGRQAAAAGAGVGGPGGANAGAGQGGANPPPPPPTIQQDPAPRENVEDSFTLGNGLDSTNPEDILRAIGGFSTPAQAVKNPPGNGNGRSAAGGGLPVENPLNSESKQHTREKTLSSDRLQQDLAMLGGAFTTPPQMRLMPMPSPGGHGASLQSPADTASVLAAALQIVMNQQRQGQGTPPQFQPPQ